MLTVKTPDEVMALIPSTFSPLQLPAQQVPLANALGRVLAQDICAEEYVPDFLRSTVDGYAVRASDTFGCSDAIPALLTQTGEVLMGEQANLTVAAGTCVAVPTGGHVPDGADAVQMVEFSEDYGDGTIGILKPIAPGNNLIFRGDDVSPGDRVLPAGRRLEPQDIGALAALGVSSVPVVPQIRVGILSTGDELVPPQAKPGPGQVRDVNSALVGAVMTQAGALVTQYGIVRDEETLLHDTLRQALEDCDMILISGGSSVGTKDATCRVMERFGSILFHGIAMKPGKPTILGKAGEKPILGLPGHPVAALFCTHLFACPLLYQLEGRTWHRRQVTAKITESVGANHGRAQYSGVFLTQSEQGLSATPIRGKSGLITTLAGSDGYFCIPRDKEGVAAGETISVTIFSVD